MSIDFGSLLEDFRPAAGAAPAIEEWTGPIPAPVVAFVEKCYKTGPQERKLSDVDAANSLQSVVKAACDQHEPRLSPRFKRTYAPLIVDGKEEVDASGNVIDDVERLLSVRVYVTKYSPRGGGVRAERAAAARETQEKKDAGKGQEKAPSAAPEKPSPAKK